DEPSRDFDAHWLTVFEHWLATCRARGTSVVAIRLLLDEPSRDFDAHWLTVFEHWLATCRARGTSVVAI
ncbi:hypothetical protein V5H41_29620, partial [Salmonella enterica]